MPPQWFLFTADYMQKKDLQDLRSFDPLDPPTPGILQQTHGGPSMENAHFVNLTFLYTVFTTQNSGILDASNGLHSFNQSILLLGVGKFCFGTSLLT